MRINVVYMPLLVLMVSGCVAPTVTYGPPGAPQRTVSAPQNSVPRAPLPSAAASELASRLPGPARAERQPMARCVNSDQRFATGSDAAILNRRNASGVSASDVLVAWGQRHFGDRAYCFIPGEGFAMRKPDWRFLFTEWQRLADPQATEVLSSAEVARITELIAQGDRVAQSAPPELRARSISDPNRTTRLEVPAGWRDWTTGDALFVAPESGFPRFVLTSDRRQSGSLMEFARAAPDALQKFYRSLGVTKQASAFDSPRWRGLTMELAGVSSGTGAQERMSLYFFPCRDRYVSIIARDLADRFETNRRVIEDFVSNAACS